MSGPVAPVSVPDDAGLLKSAYATMLEIAADRAQHPRMRELAQAWCRLYQLTRPHQVVNAVHDSTETSPETPYSRSRRGEP